MLHAIKPMIWQALQTLKEPGHEDVVKRSKLQVLSHNLSAEGVLAELIRSFDADCRPDVDKVGIKQYLDTAINEAVNTLREAKNERQQKICVERVHEVCWELCKVQIKGNLPNMLTEESTKIWWKIFNTFAERDDENTRTLFPVAMDWEEVDYWANVVLKVMALPTNSQSRREREVMASTVLTFQDALVRFNAKLNENNGMYVHDQQSKPDLNYIECAMQELNVRLFEGIYQSGSLVSVKPRHAHTKWCVLYQKGLAYADNANEVDCSNPGTFIPIGTNTEVIPAYDRNQRPVRFQLRNSQGASKSLLLEANNLSVRNKWITAIICMKHGKTPDYEKDFINRRKARLKNRQFDIEAKETMRKQKEKTRKQREEMLQAIEHERRHHETEAEQLRNATTEELRVKIAEHDARMASLINQMTELGHQYEQEKATMADQHEREMQQLVREHGNQIGSVQSELETELTRLKQQIEQEAAGHRGEVAQKDARIAELEVEVTRLIRALDALTKQMEDSACQYRGQLEQATVELTAQRGANSRLHDEAQTLTRDAGEMRQRIQGLEEQRHAWEKDRSALVRLTEEHAQLKVKATQLESSVSQQHGQSERATAELAAQQKANAQLRDEAEKLAIDVEETRQRLRGLEDRQRVWEEDRAKVERLIGENTELKVKTDQLEEEIRKAVRRNKQQIISEIREEDEILHNIIFEQTGFSPDYKIMNESVNNFNIVTSGDQKD